MTYQIVDGFGEEVCDGVSEQDVSRVAQSAANRLGNPVYAHASDGSTPENGDEYLPHGYFARFEGR